MRFQNNKSLPLSEDLLAILKSFVRLVLRSFDREKNSLVNCTQMVNGSVSYTNYKKYCYNYEINLELCRGEQANVGASKRIAPTDA
jgi:hypothetical protein